MATCKDCELNGNCVIQDAVRVVEEDHSILVSIEHCPASDWHQKKQSSVTWTYRPTGKERVTYVIDTIRALIRDTL